MGTRDINIMVRASDTEAEQIDAYADRAGSSRGRATLDLAMIGYALLEIRNRATGEQREWVDRVALSAGVVPR